LSRQAAEPRAVTVGCWPFGFRFGYLLVASCQLLESPAPLPVQLFQFPSIGEDSFAVNEKTKPSADASGAHSQIACKASIRALLSKENIPYAVGPRAAAGSPIERPSFGRRAEGGVPDAPDFGVVGCRSAERAKKINALLFRCPDVPMTRCPDLPFHSARGNGQHRHTAYCGF